MPEPTQEQKREALEAILAKLKADNPNYPGTFSINKGVSAVGVTPADKPGTVLMLYSYAIHDWNIYNCALGSGNYPTVPADQWN